MSDGSEEPWAPRKKWPPDTDASQEPLKGELEAVAALDALAYLLRDFDCGNRPDCLAIVAIQRLQAIREQVQLANAARRQTNAALRQIAAALRNHQESQQ